MKLYLFENIAGIEPRNKCTYSSNYIAVTFYTVSLLDTYDCVWQQDTTPREWHAMVYRHTLTREIIVEMRFEVSRIF